jgi:hypothetical protein
MLQRERLRTRAGACAERGAGMDEGRAEERRRGHALAAVGASIMAPISKPLFQRNNTFFMGSQLTPVNTSDPAFRRKIPFSVGPTVRFYTINVPILEMFFLGDS